MPNTVAQINAIMEHFDFEKTVPCFELMRDFLFMEDEEDAPETPAPEELKRRARELLEFAVEEDAVTASSSCFRVIYINGFLRLSAEAIVADGDQDPVMSYIQRGDAFIEFMPRERAA